MSCLKLGKYGKVGKESQAQKSRSIPLTHKTLSPKHETKPWGRGRGYINLKENQINPIELSSYGN